MLRQIKLIQLEIPLKVLKYWDAVIQYDKYAVESF